MYKDDYLFQGDFLPAFAYILNRVRKNDCQTLTIYNIKEQKSIKMNGELTHDFLFNQFAMYQPPTPNQIEDFLSHDEDSSFNPVKPTLLLIHQGYANTINWLYKMKKLHDHGYKIIIVSTETFTFEIFDWLPRNRFMFLSSGALYEDKFLGRLQSKTIIDLALNPDFDRFEYLKEFHTSSDEGCWKNSTLFIVDNTSPFRMSPLADSKAFMEAEISNDPCPFDILFQMAMISESKVKVQINKHLGLFRRQYYSSFSKNILIESVEQLPKNPPTTQLILENYNFVEKIKVTMNYEKKGSKKSKTLVITADDLLSNDLLKWIEGGLNGSC